MACCFDNIRSMHSCPHILLLCMLPTLITAVSVKIDGVIDLGPNWNYKYTLQSYKGKDDRINSYTQLEHRSRNEDKPQELVQLVSNYDQPNNNIEIYYKINESVPTEKKGKATKPIEKGKKSTGLYINPHKIKNDKANEFLKHIYKQSLTVFDNLKAKVNDYNLRRQIDALSKNYDAKFRKFIMETQDHNIKTHLGTQKVILNAIQVSSGLINRLVSVMLGDLTKKGLLRNKMSTNIVEKEVNNVIDLEYKHACTKFGVCRTGNTFSSFMADLLTILLKNDDAKLRVAIDALTETLKNNKFSSIMTEDMTKKFHESIEQGEKADISVIRTFLIIIKNILSSKYKPVVLTGRVHKRINKTLALLEIVEIFDKNLPGNEINSLEWNDIKNSMSEWSDGKRNDIVDIMQTLVDYVKKSIDRLDSRAVQKLSNHLEYFMS